MASPWTKSERRLLDAILDQLIPANPERNVPAAGQLGVAEFLGQRATADAALGELLAALLAQVAKLAGQHGEVSPGIVRRLEAAEPKAFEALLSQSYMGYYSRPDIRPLFGLSPNPTQPGGYAVPSETPKEMAALVDPVRARGRRYRLC